MSDEQTGVEGDRSEGEWRSHVDRYGKSVQSAGDLVIVMDQMDPADRAYFEQWVQERPHIQRYFRYGVDFGSADSMERQRTPRGPGMGGAQRKTRDDLIPDRPESWTFRRTNDPDYVPEPELPEELENILGALVWRNVMKPRVNRGLPPGVHGIANSDGGGSNDPSAQQFSTDDMGLLGHTARNKDAKAWREHYGDLQDRKARESAESITVQVSEADRLAHENRMRNKRDKASEEARNNNRAGR